MFQLGSEISPVLDEFLVEGNLMSGGGFSVNFRDDPGMRSVTFRGNVFVPGTTQYDGAVIGHKIPAVRWDPSNVWLGSGKPVA